MNKIPITVIIPVKNEAKNLPECLSKLKSFSQIMIIDSDSTDTTLEISKQYGVELHQFKWDGKFPKKRNWTLKNITIINEWVLFLDADEYVSDSFIEEIALKTQSSDYNGYTIQFENYFMGRKLKYGYGFKKNSLFKKSKGMYEKIEEDLWSHLDMEVHEHPLIEGKIGIIKEKVIHKDFKNLEHYIAKHNAYSSWEANRYIQKKNKSVDIMTLNQKIKYKLMDLGLLPSVYFFGAYILKLGFLDGKEGYYLAKYKANYFFQIQTKIKELKKNE